MDKKGLAVALIFLVVMIFGIRECSDTTTEQVSNAWQEQPELSDEIAIRSAGKMTRETESSGSGDQRPERRSRLE